MNKKIVSIVVAISLCTMLGGCKKDTDNNPSSSPKAEEIKIYENSYYDVAKGLEGTMIATGENLSEEELVGYTAITDSIDFTGITGVTHSHVGRVSNDSLLDMWIIKVNDSKQENLVLKRIDEYVDSIKNKYKDNEGISRLLNDDNVVIAKNDGVIMFALGSDARIIVSSMMTNLQAAKQPELFQEEDIINEE